MKDLVKMTLADQIYMILREDIINQRIKCGEKLTLKALQERFDISSTPIREAMKRLHQDGLMEHVTNIGAKVIAIGEKDIIEIYDFCSVLDTMALWLAIENSEAGTLNTEIKECVALQQKALESENISDFKEHSDNFHDILFRYADNSRLYDAAVKIRSQLSILTTRYQNYTVAKSIVYEEHKAIADALTDNDIDKAISLMKSHFEHAKQYLLKNIKAII